MSSRSGSCGGGGGCGVSLQSGFPAVVRLVLGGLFLLAGYMKLTDPQFFAFSINGFHFGLSEGVMNVLAYVVPWAELLAGGLLVLGLWARGAAMLVIVMMVAFAAGIASVMLRGLDVKCGCFGALKLFCGDQPMGWCHLIRNTAMAAAAAVVVAMGPGLMALESVCCTRRATGKAPDGTTT